MVGLGAYLTRIDALAARGHDLPAHASRESLNVALTVGTLMSERFVRRARPHATDCDAEGLEEVLAVVSYRRECVRGEGERQPSGLPVSRGA